jgi:hypothetical protein
VWNVWLQGEIMPTVGVSVDGRTIGSVGGAVGGDILLPDTSAPLRVRLAVGRHSLTIARGGLSLAPGGGGSAILTSVFLTPAGRGEQQRLQVVAPSDWRSLCGHRYVWIEADPDR